MVRARILTGLTTAALSAALLTAALVAAPPLAAAPSAGVAAGPDPVVIIAGTFSSGLSYEPLAARLRGDGYPASVFALPDRGLGDLAGSAAALATYVAGVRAQTGAAKVDLIGHSQGGIVGRYYVKYLGGANRVDSMISLASPHYGGYSANLLSLFGPLCTAACDQMQIGSAFLAALNDGDDTIGSVSYVNVVTIYDELVQPYRNGWLANDGNNTNVLTQAHCPLRVVGHLLMPLDGMIYSGVRQALNKQSIDLNCWAL